MVKNEAVSSSKLQACLNEPTSPNERQQKQRSYQAAEYKHCETQLFLESLSLGTGNYDEFGNLPPEDELTPHPH